MIRNSVEASTVSHSAFSRRSFAMPEGSIRWHPEIPGTMPRTTAPCAFRLPGDEAAV
jgi:hypothetical protein